MQMCRRKGKWKCCLWKKSRRVTSQGKFFIQSPSRKPYLPSLSTNVWQAPFLANFVSRRIHCIHSYLSNCIFPSSPFFSPSFFLCFIHPPLFNDIFSRKNKIRAKECTHFVVYISVLVLSVPSVENSRWWRSSTSVAPREGIRMHKYVPVKRVPFAVPIS